MGKLLDLYPCVLLSFQQSWISVKEIGLLNTAVCNGVDRPGLVHLLKIDVDFSPKDDLNSVPLMFFTVVSEWSTPYSFTKWAFKVDSADTSLLDKYDAIASSHYSFGAVKEYIYGSWGKYDAFNGISNSTSVDQLKLPIRFKKTEEQSTWDEEFRIEESTIFQLWETDSSTSTIKFCFIHLTIPSEFYRYPRGYAITSGYLDIDNYKNDKTRKYHIDYFDPPGIPVLVHRACKYFGCINTAYLYQQNGYGVAYFPDGDVYSGQWLDGKKHGNGILKYSDGRIVTGLWKLNKKHAPYTIKYANGDIHNFPSEGLTPTIIFQNGDVYHGCIQFEKPNAKDGVMSYANGDVYMGDWWQGQRYGRGSFVSFVGGVERVGQWVYDVFKSSLNEEV